MSTPYQQMQVGRGGNQRKRRKDALPPEVAKARAAERTRRNVEARRRANLVLASRYPEEFEELLAVETAGVNEERGPLPGDEP